MKYPFAHTRNQWITGRSLPVALAVPLSVMFAAGCGGAGGQATSTETASTATAGTGMASTGTSAASSSASLAAAASAHPCSVITGAQIDQVMGQSFPAPAPQSVGSFDQCTTENAAGIQVAIAIPPQAPGAAGTKASVTVFQKGRPANAVAVTGVGDSAYCFSMGMVGYQLFALKGTTVVEVLADSCAHTAGLARIVLTHI